MENRKVVDQAPEEYLPHKFKFKDVLLYLSIAGLAGNIDQTHSRDSKLVTKV